MVATILMLTIFIESILAALWCFAKEDYYLEEIQKCDKELEALRRRRKEKRKMERGCAI